MALMRWRPGLGLWSSGRNIFDDLQDDINRAFYSFWSSPPTTRESRDLGERSWSPRVDVEETDKEISVIAELPGMSKEEIKIDVKNNTLTLSGEKKHEKETKEKSYYHLERRYGSFQRSFMIPSDIDSDKIKASYKDGILKVTLPKTKGSETKRIDVNVE